MDKERVNALLPIAYQAIKEVKIEKEGKVEKTFRGHISTFGTAISQGSLLSAIAFFSEAGGAGVDRTKLLSALNYMLNPACDLEQKNNFYAFVLQEIKSGREEECKEDIIHAAIALKLAMNLYILN